MPALTWQSEILKSRGALGATCWTEIIKLKHDATQQRWITAGKDHAFDLIRDLPIFETQAEHFLRVLERGRVATNVFLRRVHNFALDMGWLPWPVLPKKQWPKVEYGAKRAITWEEHRRIVEREQNPERRSFYELCWLLGGSQGDLASLRAEDIDWGSRVVSYRRQKTKTMALLHFGDEVAALLRQLPASGPLFPYLRRVRAADRATEFRQRCRRLGIEGVTLHSYRYAWAERTLQCGYPERFAQQALGHNSKAVHPAYSKHAEVIVPSLDDWEKQWKNNPYGMKQPNKVMAVAFWLNLDAPPSAGCNGSGRTSLRIITVWMRMRFSIPTPFLNSSFLL